jgi:hypothetical protein
MSPRDQIYAEEVSGTKAKIRGRPNWGRDRTVMLDMSGDRPGFDKAERNQTKAEQGPRNQCEVRGSSHQRRRDA